MWNLYLVCLFLPVLYSVMWIYYLPFVFWEKNTDEIWWCLCALEITFARHRLRSHMWFYMHSTWEPHSLDTLSVLNFWFWYLLNVIWLYFLASKNVCIRQMFAPLLTFKMLETVNKFNLHCFVFQSFLSLIPMMHHVRKFSLIPKLQSQNYLLF